MFFFLSERIKKITSNTFPICEQSVLRHRQCCSCRLHRSRRDKRLPKRRQKKGRKTMSMLAPPMWTNQVCINWLEITLISSLWRNAKWTDVSLKIQSTLPRQWLLFISLSATESVEGMKKKWLFWKVFLNSVFQLTYSWSPPETGRQDEEVPSWLLEEVKTHVVEIEKLQPRP